MIQFNQPRPFRPTEILNHYRLPARLDVEQAAGLLGFQPYELSLLVRAKLLQPLGKPAQNSRKMYAATDIQERMVNRQWLDTATKIVARLVKEANGRCPKEPAIAA